MAALLDKMLWTQAVVLAVLVKKSSNYTMKVPELGKTLKKFSRILHKYYPILLMQTLSLTLCQEQLLMGLK